MSERGARLFRGQFFFALGVTDPEEVSRWIHGARTEFLAYRKKDGLDASPFLGPLP